MKNFTLLVVISALTISTVFAEGFPCPEGCISCNTNEAILSDEYRCEFCWKRKVVKSFVTKERSPVNALYKDSDSLQSARIYTCESKIANDENCLVYTYPAIDEETKPRGCFRCKKGYHPQFLTGVCKKNSSSEDPKCVDWIQELDPFTLLPSLICLACEGGVVSDIELHKCTDGSIPDNCLIGGVKPGHCKLCRKGYTAQGDGDFFGTSCKIS